MSRTKAFPKVHMGTQESNRLQTNIQDAITAVLRCPILDGRLIESVALAIGDTKLEHKLGRKIKGYFIAKKSAPADIYLSFDDDLFFTLNASAGTTVSVWVF